MDAETERLLNQKLDAESYEGKPLNLSPEHKAILASFVEPMWERIAEMPQHERLDLIAACLSVSPINCGWQAFAVAKLLHSVAVFDAAVFEAEQPTPA